MGECHDGVLPKSGETSLVKQETVCDRSGAFGIRSYATGRPLQPGIVEIFIFLAKRELVEAAPGDAVRRGGGRLVRRGRQGGGGKTDAGARGETKRRIRKRQTERRRGEGYARG